jgi:transcriptional regulator with XRE-family HTH domain
MTARNGDDRVAAFYARMRERRIRSGISIEQLMEALGLSKTQTYALLRGTRKKPPSAEELVTFLTACGAGEIEIAGWLEERTYLEGHYGALRAQRQATRSRPSASPPAAHAPRLAGTPDQLPRRPTMFTGRVAELRRVLDLPPDTGALTVITGTAGVGKTALALEAAHRLRAAHPDGVLFADLRGHDDGRPEPTARVLRRFVTALGGTVRDPDDVDELAGEFLSRTA